MRRLIKHPLLVSIVIVAVIYVVLAYVLTPPIPKALVIQYMVIIVVGTLLLVSFDDATAARFAAPIVAVLGDPKLALLRWSAMLAIVALASWTAYGFVRPTNAPPLELRTVHPAPPTNLRVYGKSYDLLKLNNPIRAKNPKGTEGYSVAVAEGRKLYYQNCFFCHGDKLNGQGHFGAAFSPRPANFQDVGTIAQLQESYLFWRVTTGGPGLPREGTPWASAMPVWSEMLKEDQVWKIIMFLYDYTGYEPRSWEKAGDKAATSDGKTAAAETAAASSGDGLSEKKIDAIYAKRCSQCHGVEGDGDSITAPFLYPRPRDFTFAQFKFKTTQADDEFPSDADLRKTIRNGLPGTAMPGWKDMLSDAEINGLILKIKQFGEWDAEDFKPTPIDLGTIPKPSPELLAKGKVLFKKICSQCHGEEGRGNITSGKKLKDDPGNRIWPRNLTRPETWRYTKTVTDVFQRLSTGIRGTPMPEHTTTLKIPDRWAIANYVMTLRNKAVPLSKGQTVVTAAHVKGALPTDANDPAWAKAPARTFLLAPNIIKDPRLYTSQNHMVTVRALVNKADVAIRLDVDDRTFSVPGDPLELQYRIDGVAPTRDAIAVEFPVTLSNTSEKPWFRHGDKNHPVNMWYWAAPSKTPQASQSAVILDASGPDKPPAPRAGSAGLSANGAWNNGQWRVVFKRSRKTDAGNDLQFRDGTYIPIAFADWDGVHGDKGGHHSLTSWYWLQLQPQANRLRLYGVPGLAGLLVAILFLLAARAMRRRYTV